MLKKIIVSITLILFITSGYSVVNNKCIDTDKLLANNPQNVLLCAQEALYKSPKTIKSLSSHKIGETTVKSYIISTIEWPWYPKTHPVESSDLTKSTWTHLIQLYIPKNILTHTAILEVTGGKNPITPDNTTIDIERLRVAHAHYAQLAKDTHSVVIRLFQIPNQPIKINNKNEKEDGIVAYTWMKFIENPQKYTYFPLQIPMSVAVSAAMDWSEETLKKEKINIEKFIITGASKRGWATWLSALIDNRIIAIIPVVIDILNAKQQFDDIHTYYSYHWPIALFDYQRYSLTNYQNFPWQKKANLDLMMHIIDPFQYRYNDNYKNRLSIPKYIVNASGDDFFIPNASLRYFQHLPGDNTLRYVENSGHYVNVTTLFPDYAAFINLINKGIALPQINVKTEFKDNNFYMDIIYQCNTDDCNLNSITGSLYKAYNPIALDFRYNCMAQYNYSLGSDDNKIGIYQAYPISFEKGKTPSAFTAKLTIPITDKGWQSVFVKLQQNTKLQNPITITTPVYIINGKSIMPYNTMPQTQLSACKILV